MSSENGIIDENIVQHVEDHGHDDESDNRAEEIDVK